MSVRFLSGVNIDSNTLFVDDANNRVGIGTNSPSRQLELVGADAYIQLTRSSTSTQATLGFNTGATNDWLIRTGDGSTSNLQFYSYGTSSYVMTIARSSGNVGIGTTSPVSLLNLNNGDAFINVIDTLRGLQFGYAGPSHGSYRAAVMGGAESYGGTDSGMLTFHTQNGYVVSAIPPERMRITSAGNVGIGTTAPSYKLDVSGDIRSTTINLGTQGVNVSSYGFLSQTLSGQMTFLGHNVRASSTVNNTALVVNGGWISSLIKQYYNEGITFHTSTTEYAAGATYPLADTERMRITSAGNVGIGTTSTFGRLQISGTVGNPDLSSATATGVSLVISNNDTGYGTMFATYGNGNGALQQRRTNTNTYYDFLLQPHGGNVGIGTSSPVVKLQVDGTITSTGVLTAYTSVPSINIGHNGDSAFIAATSGSGANTPISFSVGNNNEKMRIASTGATRLNSYGSGSFTGTVAYNLAVDSSGNIIETAGGVVDGSGTANYVSKWSDANTLTNSLLYDNGSTISIGLGSTTPSYTSAYGYPQFAIESNAFASSHVFTHNDTNGNYSFFALGKSKGTAAAPTIVENSETIGDFQFWAYDGAAYRNTAFIRNQIDGEPGAGDVPGRLVFGTTNDGSSSASEKMRITAAGNVGIGTTSPGERLELAGSNVMLKINASTDTFAQLGYYENGTLKWNTYNNYANDNYQVGNSGGTYFAITPSGNVGIGTTAPDAKLVVVGQGTGLGKIGDAGFGSGNYTGISLNGTLSTTNYNILSSTSDSTLYINRPSGASISFREANGGNQVSIISGGNVGIGTASPAHLLDVSGTARILNGIYFNNASGSFLWETGANALRFGTNNTERMRIDASGNVGIGITSVSARLSIASVDGSNDEKLQRWVYYAPTPNEYYLDLKQTVTSAVVRYNFSMVNAGTAYNDVLVLDRGNVGIGNTDPSQKLHVSGNIRVTGAYYDSNNSAGSSGQVLSSTGSGTAWVNQGEATATSLYDLLPAARTTYDWTVQLTAGTWADIFSSNTVLSNGTWMVQAFVNDYAVGGQQYSETYSGVMSWGSAGGTNNDGVDAESEIILHRSGHAAQAGNFYLRTVERAASTLLFQGMSNQTYSAASTINFKFVKIF